MTKRSSSVELMRFISCIFIVTLHIFHFGPQTFTHWDGWIYVEMFLIITGFYTARHFENAPSEKSIPRRAVEYTFAKFKSVYPWFAITLILGWLLRLCEDIFWNEVPVRDMFKYFCDNLIPDLFMLPQKRFPIVDSLWYIMVLALVFPLFCLIMQITERYLILIITALFTFVFYSFGVEAYVYAPLTFLRVFAGLCLGAMIYELSVIFKDRMESANKTLLTVIEAVTFAFPILMILIFFNLGSFECYLICLAVMSFIMLPGFSHSARINSRFLDHLGKLSMPLYIIHYLVGTVVRDLAIYFPIPFTAQLVIYYAGSILAAELILLCRFSRSDS